LKYIILLLFFLNLYAEGTKLEFKSNYGMSTEGNLLSKFKDAKVVLSSWLEETSGIHKGDVNIEFYDNSKPLYADFKKNKLDMIVIDLPFFFENIDAILSQSSYLWSATINGKKVTKYYLLSNKSKNLNGFSDLKNKKMSIKKDDLNAIIWLKKNY